MVVILTPIVLMVVGIPGKMLQSSMIETTSQDARMPGMTNYYMFLVDGESQAKPSFDPRKKKRVPVTFP